MMWQHLSRADRPGTVPLQWLFTRLSGTGTEEYDIVLLQTYTWAIIYFYSTVPITLSENTGVTMQNTDKFQTASPTRNPPLKKKSSFNTVQLIKAAFDACCPYEG